MIWRRIVISIFVLFVGLLTRPSFGQIANDEVLLSEVVGPQPARPLPDYVSELVVKYLPTNMTPTDNNDEAKRQLENGVARKVGEDIFHSAVFTKNSIGRLVKDVKGFTTRSLNLSSKKSSDGTGKFRLKIDGYARKASLIYEDYFNTSLNFVGQDHNIQLLVSRAIAPHTLLSLKEESPASRWAVSSIIELGYKF